MTFQIPHQLWLLHFAKLSHLNIGHYGQGRREQNPGPGLTCVQAPFPKFLPLLSSFSSYSLTYDDNNTCFIH